MEGVPTAFAVAKLEKGVYIPYTESTAKRLEHRLRRRLFW